MQCTGSMRGDELRRYFAENSDSPKLSHCWPEQFLNDYQDLAIDFTRDRDVSVLLMAMGLGKTITSLSYIKRWLIQGEVRGVLVVAPLRVVRTVWRQESANWDHTYWLKLSAIIGTPKDRVNALNTPAHIHLINYENFVWLVDYLTKEWPRRTPWPFDAIVWDELTKMKGHSSKRFKAYKRIKKRFVKRVGLTGANVPSSYFDLYSQYYCIDSGERLGTSFYAYRQKYFYPTDYNQYNWALHHGAADKIKGLTRDITLQLDKSRVKMPEELHEPIYVELPPKAKALYKKLKKDLFTRLDSGETIEAENAAVLTGKCHQVANGALYTDNPEFEVIHSAKLDALSDILDDVGAEPVLIFYNFKHDAVRIKELLRKRLPKGMKIPHLGDKATDKELETTMEEWNTGLYPYMLAHPDSAGHGLNLQKGGHIMVWFSLTYNLDNFKQAIARLARQGQLSKTVFIYYLLSSGTIDTSIFRVLQKKDAQQSDFMNAMLQEEDLI